MAKRQGRELFSPHGEEQIDGDHERACPQLDQSCKSRIEVAFGAGVQNMELQPEGAGRSLHVARGGLGKRRIGRIDKQRHDVAVGISSCRSPSRFAASSRPKLVAPVTLPPGRLRLATSPSATGSPPVKMTIGIVAEARCAASAAGVRTRRGNHAHLTANQIGGQDRQAIVLSLAPTGIRSRRSGPRQSPPRFRPWRKAR